MTSASAISEPAYQRGTPRKQRAGFASAVAQMFIWNPFPDLVQGTAARIVGTNVFKVTVVVGSAVYYVWIYRKELSEISGMVVTEMSTTVTEVPYRSERGLALRMAIPDLLSLSRPALGLFAAVLLWQGRPVQALAVYAFGIVTDVVDGWLARRLRGGTSWGKDLDGLTDSVMNLFVFGAVVANGIEARDPWFLGVSVFLVLLWVGTRLFAAKHSVVAKYRSGVTRSVLYVAIAVMLPSPWQWIGLGVGAVLLVVGGGYEFGVTRKDLSSGRRPLVGEGWFQTYRSRDTQAP